MTADLDIYRAAKLILDQHGDGAAEFVLKRCEQLFDEGRRGRDLAADPECDRRTAEAPTG
jgi:hypothetical protein